MAFAELAQNISILMYEEHSPGSSKVILYNSGYHLASRCLPFRLHKMEAADNKKSAFIAAHGRVEIQTLICC